LAKLKSSGFKKQKVKSWIPAFAGMTVWVGRGVFSTHKKRRLLRAPF
jgi:hypothetical protein